MFQEQLPSTDLVYLFNSAYRETYSLNLHKIMASPCCLNIRMRYAIDKNVPSELKDKNGYKRLIDRNCYIIFVNRYNDKGYEFLPLRKGIIKDVYVESGYLFVIVRLGTYVSLENSVDEFTSEFCRSLKEKHLPELKDNNPDITNDGNYIVESNVDIGNQIHTSQESWFNTVKYISKTKAFEEKEAFIKVEILRIANINTRCKVCADNEGNIKISADCKYRIKITYFDPTKGTAGQAFKVVFQEPLLGVDGNIYCSSLLDDITIPFASKKNLSWKEEPAFIEISKSNKDQDAVILQFNCFTTPIWKNTSLIVFVMLFLVVNFGEIALEKIDIYVAILSTLKLFLSIIILFILGKRYLP